MAEDHRAQHLRADFDVDADGQFTRFEVCRAAPQPGAGETRLHRLGGRRLRRRRRRASWCGRTARSSTSSGATTEVPRCRGVPRGKLILVNDDDLTYCTLRLDPDSLQTVLTASPTSPSRCPAPWSGRRCGR